MVNTGTAKCLGLKSYTGVIWRSQGEKYSAYILCETNQPSISASSITISPKTNGDLEYRCGEDSRYLYSLRRNNALFRGSAS